MPLSLRLMVFQSIARKTFHIRNNYIAECIAINDLVGLYWGPLLCIIKDAMFLVLCSIVVLFVSVPSAFITVIDCG